MSNQDKINRSSPGAHRAKLGDTVAELIAQVNALTEAHNALAAKLDTDAGIASKTFAAQTAAPTAAIKGLESR